MATIHQDQVLAALGRIRDPLSGGTLADGPRVSGVTVRDAHVLVSLEIPPSDSERIEPARREAEAAIAALPGVLSATVVLTAHREAPAARAPAGPRSHDHSHGPGAQAGRRPLVLGGEIAHVVAVASGKGGVGKSTVAVNLALGLARLGLAVGVLDADIYGPSMPRMLGITGKPESADGKTLRPMNNYGLKVMSIGFLIEEETPMVWRGPMVQSALVQMLRDVDWGRLDVLIVDMPPGTGDAQLTLAQQVPLAGAVIVSTPQDIALIDARKGLNMFRKVDVPVLGIVENMSYFHCPNCGHETPVFGHGGARREAERLGVPFLGEIPLELAIRETSDAGTPIVAADPGGPQAAAFLAVAEAVAGQLRAGTGSRPAPRIVIE